MSSKYVIKESTLNSIADAVRLRSGTEAPIVVKDLPEAIKKIPDVGGYNIPNELLNCSGNCNHIFSSPLHNSFIKKYGSLINTNISNGTTMFCDNKTIENIPFDFNFYVDEFRTFVKRFNYWKINMLQYGIANDNKTAIPARLVLNGIGVKYEIGDEVR